MSQKINDFSSAYILEPYMSAFDIFIDEEMDDGDGKREPGHFIVSAVICGKGCEKKYLYFGYDVDEENSFNPADVGLSEEELTPCAIFNQIAERDWDTDPIVAPMIGWFITQEEDYKMCPDSHLWTFEVYKRPNEMIIEHFEKTKIDELQVA